MSRSSSSAVAVGPPRHGRVVRERQATAGEQCDEPDEPRGYRLRERPASGEPVLAEVGRPFMLSLGVAGYRSVIRSRHPFEGPPGSPASAVRSSVHFNRRTAVGPRGVLALASSGAAGERFW